MDNGVLSIEATNCHLWKWLKLNLKFDSELKNIEELMADLSEDDSNAITILGCEFSLKNNRNAFPDFSFLVEHSSEGVAASESHWIHGVVHEMTARDIAKSAWVELDYPYNSTPLLYFSLSHSLSSQVSHQELAHTFGDISEVVGSLLPKHINSILDWPSSDDFSQWLGVIPKGEVQQIGLSFRGAKVQPRLLINIGSANQIAPLFEPSIAKCINNLTRHNQILHAFAYPFTHTSCCGVEALADNLTIGNLRTLRQPPRIRGSRWLSALKQIVASNESDYFLDNKMLNRFSSLENRSGFPACLYSGSIHESIEISGWNHFKLAFIDQQLHDLKIYGGTVRNTFRT